MREVLDNIAATYGVLLSDLTLDPTLAHTLEEQPPVTEAIGILLIAMVSVTIGHAIVLGVNGTPWRMWPVALGFGAFVGVALRALQAVAVWGLATAVTGQDKPLLVLAIMIILSLAPQVLAVIYALPHVGIFLGRLLEVWSLVIMVTLVTELYDMSRWLGLAVVGGAWLLTHVASRLLAEPVRHLGSRLWTRAIGRPTLVTAQDILTGTPFMPVDARIEAR